MRVLRIVGGIVVMLGGMGFLFKAGGPSRYGHYSGPPPDGTLQIAGLALIFVGAALVAGRVRPR